MVINKHVITRSKFIRINRAGFVVAFQPAEALWNLDLALILPVSDSIAAECNDAFADILVGTLRIARRDNIAMASGVAIQTQQDEGIIPAVTKTAMISLFS